MHSSSGKAWRTSSGSIRGYASIERETRGAMLQLFHSRGDLSVFAPLIADVGHHARRTKGPDSERQKSTHCAGQGACHDRRTTDDLRCCAKGGIVDMSVYSNDIRPPATPSLLTQHDRSRIEGRIAAGQYLHASHLASEWALSQELAQRLFQCSLTVIRGAGPT